MILIPFLCAAVCAAGVTAQELRSGYVRVDGTEAVVSALYSLENDQGILISEAAVSAVVPFAAARIFVDQRNSDTGIAVVNAGSQPVIVDLTLRNSSGEESALDNLSLAAGGQQAIFVSQLFDGLPAGFVGSLELRGREAGDRIAAVTIRQGSNPYGEPLFATLPVIPLESVPAPSETPGGGPHPVLGRPSGGLSELVFPHVGAGSAGSSLLSTQILLLERSGSAVSGQIRFFASSGEPLLLRRGELESTAFDFDLPSNGVAAFDFDSPGGVVQGFARVALTSGESLPGATAVFQFRRAGGELVSEAGVPAAPLTLQATSFLDNVQTESGIALAFPTGDSATAVTFRLRDRQGRELASTQRMVAAGGHLASYASTLFPGLPASFTGSIQVEAARPMSVVALKLTFTERSDPILTTLPVGVPLMSPAGLEGSVQILPQIGFGVAGGLSIATRLLVLDRGEGGASGTLSFFDGQGMPLPVPLAGAFSPEAHFAVPAGGAAQLRPGNTSAAASLLFTPPSDRLPVFTPAQGQELSLSVGESGVLRALVVDTAGRVRDDFAIDFLSLDESVLAVGEQGAYQALDAGFATVTLSVQGVVSNLLFSVTDVDSASGAYQIGGITVDRSGRLYLAAPETHTILLAAGAGMEPDIWAGREGQSGLVDDLRVDSLFNRPGFLDLDLAAGQVFVSDRDNHALRRIRIGPGGEVATLVGGEPGDGDGTVAVARLREPGGVALDAQGYLWIADSGNHAIRRLNLASGVVETIAGAAGHAGFQDGRGDQARFRNPLGLALLGESLDQALIRQSRGEPPPPVSVIVADRDNQAIRRVTADGDVQTLALFSETEPAGLVEQGDRPLDLTADAAGNIFLVRENNRLTLLLRNGELVEVASGALEELSGVRVHRPGSLVAAGGNRTYLVGYGAPEITSVLPEGISDLGGQEVRVEGRNFAPETAIVVADRVIDGVFSDSGLLVFIAPPLPSGLTTLTVFHRGGLAQAPLRILPQPVDQLPAGTITTFAGGATFAGDGRPALEVSLDSPRDVKVDSVGNLYIVERNRHRVRRVDGRTGIINTVAGNGTPGFSGDGGPAPAAALCFPDSLELAANGDILLSDTANNRIRRIEAGTLTIRTIAGSAPFFAGCTNDPAFAGDGGAALEARLASPRGIAETADGVIYFADGAAGRVRSISPAGTIETIAGTETPGYSGDGGPASQAQLGPRLFGLDLGPKEDELFIADRSNHVIRRIDLRDGSIETVAGSGVAGYAGDGGPAVAATLNFPRGVASGTGRLVIADSLNAAIRGVNVSGEGEISTLAGQGMAGDSGDGGPAAEALLDDPWNLTLDSAGAILIADTGNRRIREVGGDGTIRTVAGTQAAGFPDIGQPAAAAGLQFPTSVAIDSGQNLLILDRANRRLLRIRATSGLVELVAGDGSDSGLGDGGPATLASLSNPRSMALDAAGNIYLTDDHRIRLIDAVSGTIETVAGNFFPGFGGDGGAPLDALFSNPEGLAVDADQALLIADAGNARIRRLDFNSNAITTVAGNGSRTFSGDGGDPLLAGLAQPAGLVLTSSGDLFVSDPAQQRVRQIAWSENRIVTVAGSGVSGFDGDGGPAILAALDGPQQMALFDDRHLLIADSHNRRVRIVDLLEGRIETLAGNGSLPTAGDNGPAGQAAIGFPFGITIDKENNVYISDVFNQRIRVIRSILVGSN